MFQLGVMGTFIVPIDLSESNYGSRGELSRVKNDKFSKTVTLVNYVVDKTVWYDSLSSENIDKWGDEPEALFYASMESPELFRTITKELLAKYQKYTH